MHPQDITLSKK